MSSLLSIRAIRIGVWVETRRVFSSVLAVVLLPITVIAYALILIWIAQQWVDWNAVLWKDSLYWVVLSGFALAFKTAGHRNPKQFWGESIREQVAIVVFLTIIVNMYTFSFWIELLLVPLILFLTGLAAAAKNTDDFAHVAGILNGILAIIGWTLLVVALWRAVGDYRAVASWETLQRFLLPVKLAVAFLPLLYIWALYVGYDKVVRWLSFAAKGDRKLRKELVKEFIVRCHVNLDRITRAAAIAPIELMRVESKEELESLFARHGVLAG